MKKTENSRQFFRSLEAESLKSRSRLTKIADSLTAWCGSTTFLILNAIFFIVWISLNIGIIPGLTPFDPFPFGLLTMAVSLEAIFLSIFVLISQNRSSYTSTLRDEVHLQVNLIAEQEITKILRMLEEMKSHMGLDSRDPELIQMVRSINETTIEQEIQAEIEAANSNLLRALKEDLPHFFHPKKTSKNI